MVLPIFQTVWSLWIRNLASKCWWGHIIVKSSPHMLGFKQKRSFIVVMLQPTSCNISSHSCPRKSGLHQFEHLIEFNALIKRTTCCFLILQRGTSLITDVGSKTCYHQKLHFTRLNGKVQQLVVKSVLIPLMPSTPLPETMICSFVRVNWMSAVNILKTQTCLNVSEIFGMCPTYLDISLANSSIASERTCIDDNSALYQRSLPMSYNRYENIKNTAHTVKQDREISCIYVFALILILKWTNVLLGMQFRLNLQKGYFQLFQGLVVGIICRPNKVILCFIQFFIQLHPMSGHLNMKLPSSVV